MNTRFLKVTDSPLIKSIVIADASNADDLVRGSDWKVIPLREVVIDICIIHDDNTAELPSMTILSVERVPDLATNKGHEIDSIENVIVEKVIVTPSP